MSMTDPVADFLTRIRNAAKARHHDVAIPSSKLKLELARILKEQGYIDGYEVTPPIGGRPGETITVTLKYTEDRQPVISGMQRVSRPGQRTYVDHAHIPRIQGGMGTAIISTSRGRHDRPRRPPAKASAAKSWQGSGRPLSQMSRIGRQPIPVPAGVTVSIEPSAWPSTVPGELSERSPSREIERSSARTDGEATRHAAHRPRRAPCPARPDADARRQHGRRASRRASRSGWRSRASATARSCAVATSSWRSVTRTRSRSRRPKASSSRFRCRRGSSSAAPPSSRSARSPPRFASSASPSRTRARESATRASTSPGRSGKRA